MAGLIIKDLTKGEFHPYWVGDLNVDVTKSKTTGNVQVDFFATPNHHSRQFSLIFSNTEFTIFEQKISNPVIE